MGFYSGGRLVRKGSNVEVWTKELSLKLLNEAVLSADDEQRWAKMIADGYVPPITKLLSREVPSDQVAALAMYEAKANEANIGPEIRMLWEFDCDGHRGRLLSVTSHGRVESQRGEWKALAPQTIADNLMVLVCQ